MMRPIAKPIEKYLAKAISYQGNDKFSNALYEWLKRSFNIDNCTILAFFQTSQPDVFFRHSNVQQVHQNIDRYYVSRSYLLDPFHDLHVNKAKDGLYRLRDCAPDHFHRNEYFAEYYKRTTLIDEICFHARAARGVSVQVCMGRDSSSNRSFSAQDLKTANRLAPIVCSLISVQWKHLTASGDYTDASLIERLQIQLKEHKSIKLSKRQCEVALFILRGHSTISIGLCLGISPQTVKVFRKQLYRKCGISSQAELFSLMVTQLD